MLRPPFHGLSSPRPCRAATTASICTGHCRARGAATVSEATGVRPAASTRVLGWVEVVVALDVVRRVVVRRVVALRL